MDKWNNMRDSGRDKVKEMEGKEGMCKEGGKQRRREDSARRKNIG